MFVNAEKLEKKKDSTRQTPQRISASRYVTTTGGPSYAHTFIPRSLISRYQHTIHWIGQKL